ncbi:MAG: bacterial transcriptional activator domain-containing protein, partial [Chloroflexota bacterium]|nr:bacterial transcriptional activator domain-containing protein [Chloroflexota bacterium]
MAELKLFTFGQPRLERDGQPVDLNLRKALALLVYVAVTARPHSRDALATMIWPDNNQAEARGRLRRTLYRLRDGLGESVVEASADTISLHPGADLWLDCTDFLQHATRGLHKERGAAVSPEQAEHLQAAAALYTDDFLAGWTIADSDAFDEWLFFERERLRQLFAQVLERLVQACGAQGTWDAAIPYARRWVALDPLHEPAQRYLITVYARAGQQAAAVRQYQECVRILDAELGVTPDAATTGLYEAIRSRQFPPRGDDWLLPAEQAAMPFRPQRTDGAPRSHTAVSSRGGDGNTQVGTSARAIRAVGREAELRRLHEHLEHALG